MSRWFGKAPATQVKETEETDKTVVVSTDTNIPDKILDITETCKDTPQEVSQDKKEENNKDIGNDKENTQDNEEDEESSDDEQVQVIENKKPEYFKLNTETSIYSLIRNHRAVGYSRTHEQAMKHMNELARELLATYEKTEPHHEFYLRITRCEDSILVMAEDCFMAVIKHARIRDELKIVEIPEIVDFNKVPSTETTESPDETTTKV